MQIDFHFATTYVLSRLAGFTAREANIIGTSAQYVDDATNGGRIGFANGASYARICSAHKMLDYKNFQELANAQVWIPFHFLPGNADIKADDPAPSGEFYQRLICRPNSPVAQEMVRQCTLDHSSDHALYRLGITMHVYADTWAHQGFVGITHAINQVDELQDDDEDDDESFAERIATFFGDLWDSVANQFINQVPLGHGAALSHPDLPFLKWRYKNGLGQRVERNNPRDFREASKHVFQALAAFRRARGDSDVPTEISATDLARISANFEAFRAREGDERLEQWKQSIGEGAFSFGAEEISYIGKGFGSWKHAALGNEENIETISDGYEWSDDFLTSDWKMFHDALQVHRLTILKEVLPSFGICAA